MSPDPTKNPTLTVVAAALVNGQGEVLLQQRPAGRQMAGLWEFPGGKLEPGETPEAALIRELDEELAIQVSPDDLEPAFFASAPPGQRHLILLLYVIRRWTGEVRLVEASAATWVHPADMHAFPMPPADVPLVAWLQRLL